MCLDKKGFPMWSIYTSELVTDIISLRAVDQPINISCYVIYYPFQGHSANIHILPFSLSLSRYSRRIEAHKTQTKQVPRYRRNRMSKPCLWIGSSANCCCWTERAKHSFACHNFVVDRGSALPATWVALCFVNAIKYWGKTPKTVYIDRQRPRRVLSWCFFF